MKTLEVKASSKTYPIYIEKGLLGKAAQIIRGLYKGDKIGLITDSNVDRLYADALVKSMEDLGLEVVKVVVSPGEGSKSIKTFEEVCERLLAGGVTRSDIIVNLGGGVVGDLGGFVASALLRGIRFIQIPTSLLAQIDSSVGGKVAVNLPSGKNLVGSFYQPEAVIIDPELLRTLDIRFFRDGMAEVIKYACIRDEGLFNLLEGNDEHTIADHIEDIVETCCSIKRDIVELDELDKGERMLLNFGHTLAHAVEQYFNYERYTHGEAVAIGMIHITRKGEQAGLSAKGTCSRLTGLVKKYNLPFEMPVMESQSVIDTLLLDKKGSSRELSIILISEIGKGFMYTIDKSSLGEWI